MATNKQETNPKPCKHYEPWSARDDDFLARNYLVKPVQYITQKLGRSVYAVQRRIVDLGLSRKINRKLWKTVEIRFLQEHYEEHGAKWCARHMQRTEKAIRNMAVICRLKYHNKSAWSDEDVLTLRRLWRRKEPVATIAKALSRSVDAVSQKASSIGLRRRAKVKKPAGVKQFTAQIVDKVRACERIARRSIRHADKHQGIRR